MILESSITSKHSTVNSETMYCAKIERFGSNMAVQRNKVLNISARKSVAEYCIEVVFLQYIALLFNYKQMNMELINFKLYSEFVHQLFEVKNMTTIFFFLMVRSLANTIFKKIWVKLIIMFRQPLQVERIQQAQAEKQCQLRTKWTNTLMMLEPKLD